MPFNGSGVYQRVRNWVADAAAGIKIRADYHDAEDDGFAAGLTNCITKDGQTIVTQNIPMNSKRVTGLADPINPQDASTKAYTDTKMPLIGGTITGNLTINGDLAVNGKVAAYGYQTRQGLAGPFGSNWFNFFWDGTLRAYIDDYHFGAIASQDFANTAAANSAAGKVNRSGDTMTGQLTTADAVHGIPDANGMGTIEVRGAHAAMSFHIPSVFACNFGMSTDGNFYMGGWSHGASTAYRFWTTRDFAALPTGSISGVRLALAGNASWTGGQTVSEPFAGACCTGLSAAAGGGMTGRFRYLQILSGSWFTVAYT